MGQDHKPVDRTKSKKLTDTSERDKHTTTNAMNKDNSLEKVKKSIWRVGTWNVRGVNGKEKELEEEFGKIDLDLLGITETKKKGKGVLKMNSGIFLIYSGVKGDMRASCGVGCILKQNMVDNLRKWDGISERILTVEISQGRNGIYTFIIVYAPNENETMAVKEQFWEDLTIATENSKGRTIVLGDFSGRVGKKDNTTASTIGRHGEEKRNNNGRRLLDYCMQFDLIVTNTFYMHRDIHRFTSTKYGREIYHRLHNYRKMLP